MANEDAGRMGPKEWNKATNALVALSQKAQEHVVLPKENTVRPSADS